MPIFDTLWLSLKTWLPGPDDRRVNAEEAGEQPWPRYSDIFDIMRYEPPEATQAGMLPMLVGFRNKPHVQSLDARPSFAILETGEELQEWNAACDGPIVFNEDGYVTDMPLLKWNDVPSMLTSSVEIVATYFPVDQTQDWPSVLLQAHPFETSLSKTPARDRYYFGQGKAAFITTDY